VAERLRVAPVPRVVLGSRASPAPIRGWADKLADALPGALPARSSPLWAALAGLLVVTILWLAALALFPPGRQASGAPPA
jgi:hypothetical protein